MNKMPSLKDVMLGKKPMIKESPSRSFNKPLTLAGIAELVEDEYISKYSDEDERIKDPDEKEMEDAEADDTLQYTGVGGDDVEEFWVDTTKKGDKASTGYKADNHPMDLGSGFDFGGGYTGPDGSKTKFLQKMPPKQSVHDKPGGFTGHGDRMAYKDMMKTPKKQSGFGF